jgi:hypothetical protein
LAKSAGLDSKDNINPSLSIEKPIAMYWKMWAFNCKLSRARIAMESVLGMIVKRYGMLWQPIVLDVNKVPTFFQVLCKLHKKCMDQWMMHNPVDAQVGRFTNAHALPNSEDDNLW